MDRTNVDRHSQIPLPEPYRWRDGTISFEDANRTVVYSPFSGAFLRATENRLNRGQQPTSGQLAVLEEQGFILRAGRPTHAPTREDRVSLTIAPTVKCNLTCSYCFQDSHRGGASSQHHSSFADEIVKYITSKSVPSRIVDIEWFGGEPLIAHRDIINISKRLDDLGIEFRSTLVTNGVLFRALQDDFCQQARLQAVQVTLDGGRERHDRLRTGRSYSSGTFDHIVSAVRWFLSHDVHVTVRVNVGAMTSDGAGEIVDEIASCFEVGPSLSFYAEQYDAERWSVEAVAACHHIEDALTHLGFNIKPTSIERFFCGAMDKSHLSIGPDLKVYSCYNEIGDLSKVDGQLQGGASTGRYERFLPPAPCRKCPVRAICFGRGCPSLATKGDFSLNEGVCDLIRDRIMARIITEYIARYKVSA